jgi:hypothetical protein
MTLYVWYLRDNVWRVRIGVRAENRKPNQRYLRS